MTYDEYVRREQEWDDARKVPRLYGDFYFGPETMLFPYTWLDAAMDPKRWKELNRKKRYAQAMGVDVAAGGGDKTCWAIADEHGVMDIIVRDTSDTMEICGLTTWLMKKYNIPAECVAMDAGGLGKPITDRLKELGYDVQPIGFGESADAKTSYRNRRAEMYGEFRALLDPNRPRGPFALPPNAHQLRQQLAVLPLQYDSEERLILPPKRDLRRQLGRSTDEADAVVMTARMLLHPGEPLVWPDDDFIAIAPGEHIEPMTKAEREELDETDPGLRAIYDYYCNNPDFDFDDDDDWDRRSTWRRWR